MHSRHFSLEPGAVYYVLVMAAAEQGYDQNISGICQAKGYCNVSEPGEFNGLQTDSVMFVAQPCSKTHQ